MPAEITCVNFVMGIVLAVAASTGLAGIRYGAPAPVFDVPSMHGAIPLTSLRGKPVIINFWATWCPPCTAELPNFVRLEREYGNRIAIVTVSNEPTGVARAYFAKHGYDLPLLEDSKGNVFALYSIKPVPDTLVLDASGNVTFVSVGGLDWKELQTAVDRALPQPSALSPSNSSVARPKATSALGSRGSGLLRWPG